MEDQAVNIKLFAKPYAIALIQTIKEDQEVRMEFAKMLRTFVTDPTLNSYEQKVLKAEETRDREIKLAHERYERIKAGKLIRKTYDNTPLAAMLDDDEETV